MLLRLDLFLLLRNVTDAGTWPSSADPARGDALGLLADAGGNFDLTDCTRSSIFCMRPIRPLIWYSEPDLGRASESDWRGLGGGGPMRWLPLVVDMLADVTEGPLEWRGFVIAALLALGVALLSGRSDLLVDNTRGFGPTIAASGTSESGGEGGVCATEFEASDFPGGGVEVVGDGGVVIEV